MPFPLRTVQPTYVCRFDASDGQESCKGPALIFNSLQEVSSHSLLAIIRQLSDLSKHAEDIFGGIQGEAVALGQRSAHLQHRLSSLQPKIAHLDHKKVPVPVSTLDEESKYTVHYRAAWHQQDNVFLPSSRPPCVEDLHQEAKLNLKSVLRECDKLRRDGCRSSQYYSQGPTFSSSSSMVCTSYQEDSQEHDRKFSDSSNEEERLISNRRPNTPVSKEFSDTQTNWTKALPLPTPEEKMRQEAQSIQTDVIPINVTAGTGTGQLGFRGHSMYIPDNYSTLEKQEICRRSAQQSDTRDFSCQTEEIRVVPPSVRRIRAQKGQGIAALMSNSSGNMSTLSDPSGCTSRLNGDLHFRSLPRSGAHVCLLSLDKKQDNPNQRDDSYSTLPRQLSKLQVDDSVVHLRNNPRAGTLQRPKSQEIRGTENEFSSNPARVVSPHAAYSTSVIPNAMLSSSSELIAIHTSQSTGHLDSKGTSHCSLSLKKSRCRDRIVGITEEHNFSSEHWSESSSARHLQISETNSPSAITMITLCDSALSLSNTRTMNNGPQPMPYRMNTGGFVSNSQDSDTHSESSYSDGRQRNGSITSSINSADQWSYEARETDSAPSRKPSSAVSGSPVSNMSTCSSDKRADSSSLYSLDHDGYYTSMHMDSGINSGSQSHDNGVQNPRHSVINILDKKEKSMDDRSTGSDKSLSRSISLKKPKKPPPPPSRTDSLRRPSKKNAQTNGQVLNETLIASLQQSLQLNLRGKGSSSASQSPCSDYEDPWILRSRSQSTVSASSSGMSATAPNMYSICAVTPSQSDTSSIKSEYADQWSYIINYSQTSDEQLKLHGIPSPTKNAHINNYNASELNYGVQASMPQDHSGLAKQNNSSPEKPCRVTSPSSGYSSQSNTPTTLTPVPLQLKSMSPGNGKSKKKPKVPERRSSLISSLSISSSSTSLSSNTSDSMQQSTKQSTGTLLSLHTPPTPPLTPDPPPPPAADVVDSGNLPSSPSFPPPPPEFTMFTLSTEETPQFSHSQYNYALLNYPPPPPPLPVGHSVVPPPPPLISNKMVKTRTELVPKQKDKRNLAINSLNNHLNKQDNLRPTAPLVTAHALQMVQLKSVKKALKSETKKLAEQVPDSKLCDETSSSFSRPSLAPSATPDMRYSEIVRENRNNLPEEKLQQSIYQSNTAKLTTGDSVTEKTVLGYKEDDYQTTNDGNTSVVSQMSTSHKTASTLQSSPYTSPNKKPPPISKKPKLFLIVPPPQLDLAAEKIAEINENVSVMPSSFEKKTASERCEELHGWETAENNSEETAGLTHQAEEAGLSVCEVAENTRFIVPTFTDTQNKQEEEEQPTMSDEGKTSDGNKETASCDPEPSREEESEVFEPLTPSIGQIRSYPEGNEEVMTPTRQRTTEDLFAVIHRSKRKVLGRKDSDDDPMRNHSPSPPVTPTGGVPNVSSFKQPGAIQRSIRKSNTSSDNFKALLLKKGSRSECSSRMSAAEMLKHTDPRSHRSKSESYMELPDSPTLSSKNKRSQDEWAKNEGLMPRSMSVSGTRYSRSRTPPSAASSKYNVRSRIQSSPMTVICEGRESAEIAESSFLKMPSLLSSRSLDSYNNTNCDLNDSLGAEESNVHIDLMSKLLEDSKSDVTCSLEEKS
ncbi:NHS-like protein 1 isoform X3 [Bombina bombina]|uniref:NHS-like protein 1 isoform X3 n=1 Tax=Bombina bombina TaxID=8345 RepID=UPI00235A8770|nr:NHS-like protein 1 isoform X3 [Bombina bombina]